MSAAAAWSYTSSATLWPWLGRNDWPGQDSYGPPELVACNYSAKAERRRDDRGDEYVSSLQIYTERAGIKQGDRILIGDHTGMLSPAGTGALEVRGVQRMPDVFDGLADDYTVSA